ncbi:hypothetical protein CsSME_00013056 [Camellia sinensis var. sinensis]
MESGWSSFAYMYANDLEWVDQNLLSLGPFLLFVPNTNAVCENRIGNILVSKGPGHCLGTMFGFTLGCVPTLLLFKAVDSQMSCI